MCGRSAWDHDPNDIAVVITKECSYVLIDDLTQCNAEYIASPQQLWLVTTGPILPEEANPPSFAAPPPDDLFRLPGVRTHTSLLSKSH